MISMQALRYPVAGLLVGLVALGTSICAGASARADDRAEAWAIAAQNLFLNTASVFDPADSSTEKQYLTAGAHQFHSLWARDFSFSVAGALDAGEDQAVKDSLDALFAFQRSDGLLPRGLDNHGVTSRVILGELGMGPSFGLPLQAWFETEYHVIVIDSNVVVPWAASRYVLKTGDREAAERWFPAVERAFAFLERNFFVDGLIGKQPPFSDWEDSVARTGRVAFTNALYVTALEGASRWAAFLGDNTKSAYYAEKAAETRARFLAYFWDDERGLLRNFEGDARVTTDANLFAVAHQLLSPEQSRRALAALHAIRPLWNPIPGRPTWPDYSSEMKGENVKLVGIAGYHDENYWLWITALAAMAERTVGDCAEYGRIMDALSARIAHDRTVYEIFDLTRSGTLKPTRRLFYHSERPFTWSSAMYLEAAEGGCNAGGR